MSLNNRIKPLDGLRAIAAFGVVWIHVWMFYSNPSLHLFSLDLYQLVAIAGNGVDFFFVISGFCMFLMWGNKVFERYGYFNFLYKRFLRIAPAFYVSLLVYAVLLKINNNEFPFWYNTFFHFIFLNNVVTGNTICGPFWSIGTEWHFYIILPLLIYLSDKISVPKTVLLFSFISIVLFCFVNAGYLPYEWWEKQILIRFPEFGVGILVAWFFIKGNKLPHIFSGVGGIMVGFLIMYAGRVMKFTPVLVAVGDGAFLIRSLADIVMTAGFGLILFHVITQKSFLSNWLSGKMINYLGRISYSVYLWHSLSFILLGRLLIKLPFGNWNVFPGFILISLFTIVISHFSYKYLEAFYFSANRNGSKKRNPYPAVNTSIENT